MSNFLVPSSVVYAKRKTTKSRPRSTTPASETTPSVSPVPEVAAPPGFSVPIASPAVENLPQQALEVEPPALTAVPQGGSTWQYSSSSSQPPQPSSLAALFDYPAPAPTSLLPEGILTGFTAAAAPEEPSPLLPPGITAAFTDNLFQAGTNGALVAFGNAPLEEAAAGQKSPPKNSPKNLTLMDLEEKPQSSDSKPAAEEATDDNSNDNGLHLQVLVKSIAKENLVGSPFHKALLQKLQNSTDHGMTLTLILNLLLGYPDLLNLFCTIQSQYGVPPKDLLLELSDVEVRNEKEEELFYFVKEEDSVPDEEAALVSAYEYHMADTTDSSSHRGSVQWGEGEFDGIVSDEEAAKTSRNQSQIDDDDQPAATTDTEEAPLPEEAAQQKSSDSKESPQELTIVDEESTEHRSPTTMVPNSNTTTVTIVPRIESPSPTPASASTSPTTVTTSASSSMDEEDDSNADGVLKQRPPMPKQKSKGHVETEDALRELDNTNSKLDTTTTTTTTQDESAASTTEGENTATQKEDRNDAHDTTQEDRNGGHDTSEERHEEKPKERETNEGDDARQTELETIETAVPTTTATTAEKQDATATEETNNASDGTEGTAGSEAKAGQPMASSSTANSPAPRGLPSLRPQTTLRPDQQKPPLPFHIRTSNEAMVALEFLCLLHKECEAGTIKWPESQLDVRIFLMKVTNCVFSRMADGDPKEKLPKRFVAWFDEIVVKVKRDAKKEPKKEATRLARTRKTATTQLLEQFEIMECVKKGSDLEWNPRKVDTLVKGYYKQQQLDKEKDDKSSKEGTSAQTSSDNGNSSKQKGKDKPEAVDNSKRTTNNIWQNHRRLEAFAKGNQSRGTPGVSPKTSPKVDLGLVMLKKPSRLSAGEKSILSMPVPKEKRPTASPWKVAPPGPLRALKAGSSATSESPQGTGTQENRSSLGALRPLRPVTVRPTQPRQVATAAASNNGHNPLAVRSSHPQQNEPPAVAVRAGHPPAYDEKAEMTVTSKSRVSQKEDVQIRPEKGTQLATGAPNCSGPNVTTGVGSHHRSPLSQSSGGAFQPLDGSKAATSAHQGEMPTLSLGMSQSTPLSSPQELPESPTRPLKPTPLQISNDVPVLLELLPQDLAAELSDPKLQQQLTDIVLDKGRQPVVWANGERKFLGEKHRVVSAEDIQAITEKLGGFGNSNRIGLDQQLHSISAIRNRKDEIIGLSIRVGRHIAGIATMMSDLLFSDPTKSILILGEPGSGKTTILREVTRLLAKQSDVMIVDTINEIAGDGDVPHPSVGQARRMMVPSLIEQGIVMVECVQNHSPEAMVVDKLGNPEDVTAAATVKEQGTRLIASMNGNLSNLVKNTKLQALLGVETVVLGQPLAQTASPNSPGRGLTAKSVLHRTNAPVFDLVVELCPGTHHEWKITTDTAEAVDSILQGGTYQFQHRIRDSVSGAYALV